MSDEERAREIADIQPCVRSTCQRLCMECRAELRADTLAAISAARAEEREACARIAEEGYLNIGCTATEAEGPVRRTRDEIAAAIRGQK